MLRANKLSLLDRMFLAQPYSAKLSITRECVSIQPQITHGCMLATKELVLRLIDPLPEVGGLPNNAPYVLRWLKSQTSMDLLEFRRIVARPRVTCRPPTRRCAVNVLSEATRRRSSSPDLSIYLLLRKGRVAGSSGARM